MTQPDIRALEERLRKLETQTVLKQWVFDPSTLFKRLQEVVDDFVAAGTTFTTSAIIYGKVKVFNNGALLRLTTNYTLSSDAFGRTVVTIPAAAPGDLVTLVYWRV